MRYTESVGIDQKALARAVYEQLAEKVRAGLTPDEQGQISITSTAKGLSFEGPPELVEKAKEALKALGR